MDSFSTVNTANRACALLYSYIKQQKKGMWLLPVNVCPDVPLTFCEAHIPFEFVDINLQTLCIDEKECISRISENPDKYSGIVYVRTYGYLFDISGFVSECRNINCYLRVVDDRCLCIPSSSPDMYGADMVLYSTGYCKQIDLGGGGMAFYRENVVNQLDDGLQYVGTDEEAIYKEAFKTNSKLMTIPHGWLRLGGGRKWNDYMSEVNNLIEIRLNQRYRLNKIYIENLPKAIQYPSKFNDWRFNIKVPADSRDIIINEIFRNHLFASSHYHSVNRLFDDKIYRNSDRLYLSVINLFNDNHYTPEMAEQTCIIINKIINDGNDYF